jgi:PmbA protein
METGLQDKSTLLSLCEQGVEHALAAGADQAEVYAVTSQELTVGLEKNDLHQVRQVGETTFGLRVITEHRIGFATSNQPKNLQSAAEEAVFLARASPPDPLNGLPEGRVLADSSFRIDPELESMTAADLAPLAVELMQEACGLDSRLTIDNGAVSVETTTRSIASSKGVRASFRDCHGGGFLFGMCVDGDEVGSFSWDGDRVQRMSDLRPSLSAAFRRFVAKCAGAMNPGVGESFRGSVILPPETVQDFLVQNLLSALGADAVRTGRSPLSSRLGDSIAAEGFSLTESGSGLPGFPLSSFDREGQPRQATNLIEHGVLADFLYNTYEARAADRESNGHAGGGAASQPSVAAACLQVAMGEHSLEHLLNVEKGILVTRFAGTTDVTTGDYSGVVKGGHLISGGEKRPIDGTTIAGNLYDGLRDISGISKQTQRIQGTVEAPWIRIDNVSVTAG